MWGWGKILTFKDNGFLVHNSHLNFFEPVYNSEILCSLKAGVKY